VGATIDHVAGALPEFVLACLVLALLPGPATALFLHRSIRDGRTAGLAAVAGNEIGILAWALAAGAGLTALLQANRLLFDALHVVGAVVLVWLGVSAWRHAARPGGRGGAGIGPRPGELGGALTGRLPSGRSPASAFRASLVSIAANPKAAVFAFSFFPQFLPADGNVLAATALLAAVQVVVDGAYCAGVVLLAVRVRPWLSRAAVRRRLERTLGTVLVALGASLATDVR
jgi:threonine/homoserine/homoserine lactone efflux protein